VIATSAALSAYYVDQAGGERSAAARSEHRIKDALVEDVRKVYADEAPLAFRVAVLEAASTMMVGSPTSLRASQTVYVEAAALKKTALELSVAHRDTDHLLNGQYQGEDLSYDPVVRLSDLRSRQVDIISDADKAAENVGDGSARSALTAAAVPIAVAALYGSWRLFRRRAGRPVVRDDASDDVGQYDVPWERTTDKPLRAAMTAVWLLLLFLPFLQTYASLNAQEARSEADIIGARLTASVLASDLLSGFRTQATQSVLTDQTLALSRQFVALGSDATSVRAEQTELGQVEERAAQQSEQIATEMSRTPTAGEIDNRSLAALRSGPDSWARQLAEQRASVGDSDKFGSMGQLLSVAVLFAALAAPLLGLARVDKRRHRLLLAIAAGLAAAAGLLSAGGFVSAL
jgi:hypothetical protein